MNKEKLSYYSLLSVGAVAAGFILIIGVKYILPVILPFLLAWLIAMATGPAAEKLSRKTKLPCRVYRLMLSLFLTLAVFAAVTVALWQLTLALWRFLSDIGEGNKLYDFLEMLASPSPPIFSDVFSEELANKITAAVSSMLSSVLAWLGEAVTTAASALPNAFFFLIVTVISLVYFSLDLERINNLCRAILPKKLTQTMARMRDAVIFVIKKYISSYLIIMLITYLTMLLGFLALGVNHAALIALIVAALDILPVIGVGTVIVPWSIIEIISGSKFVGIGLLVLFVINTVIRQLAEPKIVGKSLDLHPIVTLILLYVGYRLLGFFGLILFPVAAVSIGVALGKKGSEADAPSAD